MKKWVKKVSIKVSEKVSEKVIQKVVKKVAKTGLPCLVLVGLNCYDIMVFDRPGVALLFYKQHRD